MRRIALVFAAALSFAGLPVFASSVLVRGAMPDFETTPIPPQVDATALASAVAALQQQTESEMLGKIVARTAPQTRAHSEAELGLGTDANGAAFLGVVTAPRTLRW